jgi:hypothetical protein
MLSWMEIVFNPRNNVEKYVSQTLRAIHPYLAFVTYRFHVEKAREIGKSNEPLLSFDGILIFLLYRY